MFSPLRVVVAIAFLSPTVFAHAGLARSMSQRPATQPVRDIELHTPREIETLAPSGVTLAPQQSPIDPGIVGRWSLGIPPTLTQYPDRNVIGLGGTLGLLTIDASGAYAWRSQGRPLARGVVQQVIPNRHADPNRTYWLVSNGEETFYVVSNGAGIDVYTVNGNGWTAGGKRV